MGYTNKAFEELDVLDDFLLSAIAADKEVGEAFCKRVISVLLQREVGKVRVIAQCVIPALTLSHRGIRMDVEVEEFGDEDEGPVTNVYDLEPHLQDNVDLPRHNRFYQARIDSRYVNRGEKSFSKMPNLFVVTILNFDPFGYDYMMYTVENRCLEVKELEYQDGLQFIYFYTGGTKGGNKKIGTMLKYLQESTADNATDESTRELHGYVSREKMMPEVKQEYMMFDEFLYYKCKAAADEATKKTEKDTKIQDILELLEDLGEIPDGLRSCLEGIEDMNLLRRYLKLSAKAGSVEDFVEKMKSGTRTE